MILDRYTTITIGTDNNALVISPASENDVGIASGSLVLEQKIVDGDLEFGRLMSSEFSAQLFNTNQDFQGEPITVDVTEDNVTTRIFTGVIESSKQDWSNTYRDVIAYDWIYYHREDNIASWWNSFWVSTRTQATVKQIRDSLLTYMGFSALSDTYINDSQVIKNEFQQFTNIKFETIFKMLCEIQLTIPHIKGDGSFELITFGTTTTDISGMYEGSNSEWEDFTTQQITGIGIYDTSSNMVQLVGTNTNVLNIAGNLFLLNMSASQLTTIGNNMLTALTDFTFVPASVKMILSDFSLSLGKKVSTDVGNTYVMQNTYSGSLLVEQTIKGVAYSDVLNGNVPSINDDLITANKIAVVQHDIDGLSTEFGRLENNLENNYSTTTEMNSAIEQSAEGIRTEVSQTYVNQTTYNAEVQRLQDEIDGAIESYTGSAVPTLNNYPASDWTTTTERDKHLGDLYLVNASGGSYAGFYYRFDKSGSTYSWVHIPDNEVQKALADAAEANQKAEAAQATADGIADDLSDNYSTTQQMNSAINQKANEITQTVSTTYETKSDATSKFNTADANAQGYATQAKNDANAATDSKLTYYYTKTQTDSVITQKANEITLNVSENYTTKTEFGNLEIGGRNILLNTSAKQANIDKMHMTYATFVTEDDRSVFKLTGNNTLHIFNNTGVWDCMSEKLKANTTYTYSAWIKVSGSGAVNFNFGSFGHFNVSNANSTASDKTHEDIVNARVYKPSTFNKGEWTKISITFTTNALDGSAFGVYPIYNTGASTVAYMYDFKLEEGNRATDWSPAPEDTETNAVNTAKSYTDAQLQITSSSILSTVEQGYTTKTEFNNLSIGGENLLRDTSGAKSQVITYSSGQTYGVYDYYELIDTTNNLFKENDEIVISFDWAVNVTSGKFRVEAASGNPYNWGTLQKAEGTDGETSNTVTISSSNQSGHVVLYYKISAAVVQSTTLKYFRIRLDNISATFTVSNAKIERGNIATAWSPSPYDMAIGTNLLRYAPKSKAPANYQALQLNLTEKLVKGQTYTLQLWDIDISHTGKQASDINVSVFAGGDNNLLATLTGFTNGHADYKVVTFTVSVNPNLPTHLDNLWLNIYNSVPNASGTLNLTIGKWKLERGNKATEWQMNPIDASSKSEVEQLANKIAVKVNSSGRLVTAELGVDPDTSTSYFKVKTDDIDIISNGNIQLTGKSIGITSTNFSVTASGSITAQSGVIGGWDISASRLYKSGTISGVVIDSELSHSKLKISSYNLDETFTQTTIQSGYAQFTSGTDAENAISIIPNGDSYSLSGGGIIETYELRARNIMPFDPRTQSEVSVGCNLTANKLNGCKFKAGAIVITAVAGTENALFTNGWINTNLGVSNSTNSNTVVLAANGDFGAQGVQITTYYRNNTWYVKHDKNATAGNMRINYLIFYWG